MLSNYFATVIFRLLAAGNFCTFSEILFHQYLPGCQYHLPLIIILFWKLALTECGRSTEIWCEVISPANWLLGSHHAPYSLRCITLLQNTRDGERLKRTSLGRRISQQEQYYSVTITYLETLLHLLGNPANLRNLAKGINKLNFALTALSTKMSRLGHFETIRTQGTCIGNVVHVIFFMVL